MTSARKITANRANALASTGPKTAQGRAHATRNALRHALSLPVYSEPALSEEVDALAREIAGPAANAEIQELARQVAEAQVDLRRVRYARHQFLSHKLNDPYYDSRANLREKMKVMRQSLTPKLADIPVPYVENYFTPQGPAKFATILSGETKQLLAMDRYERRGRGANLPFEPSMRRAVSRWHEESRSIAAAPRTSNTCPFDVARRQADAVGTRRGRKPRLVCLGL